MSNVIDRYNLRDLIMVFGSFILYKALSLNNYFGDEVLPLKAVLFCEIILFVFMGTFVFHKAKIFKSLLNFREGKYRFWHTIIIALVFLFFLALDFQNFIKAFGIFKETVTLYLLAYFFVVIIIAPVTEEIYFRGLVYPYLKKRMNIYCAVSLQALIFVLAHIIIRGSFEGMFMMAIFGIATGLAYDYTENLFLPIQIHVFWNLYSIISAYY